MRRIRTAVLACVLCVSIFAGPATAASDIPILWDGSGVTDLGVSFGTPSAMNNLGQVVGTGGYLWSNGVLTAIVAMPGGTFAIPYGINDAGQVVGCTGYYAGLRYQSFLWENGSTTGLGTLGGTYSSANDINESGQIVGWASRLGGGAGAFLWQAGSMTDLGTLVTGPWNFWGSPESFASAINDLGQVVGWSHTNDGNLHAFLWDNGSMIDLGTLGGTSSYAADINNAGQIVGWSYTADGSVHAFLHESGMMTDLGTLPGYPWSRAEAINDLGQIVGYLGYDSALGFLYEGGVMYDLGDYLNLAPPDTFYTARAINNNGWIVGTGIPEPATLSLLAAGLALLRLKRASAGKR